MKKLIVAAALSVLPALLLSGCAGSPAPNSKAVPSPRPETAQESNLMASLNKIDPALGTHESLEQIRLDCARLGHGAPEKQQMADARMLLRNAKVAPGAVTDDAIRKVIETINASGVCKLPA